MTAGSNNRFANNGEQFWRRSNPRPGAYQVTFLWLVLLFHVLSFMSPHMAGNAVSAESPPNEPPPLLLNAAVPPLVMLVMARDHSLYYEAYNDASDINGDGELDIGYQPAIDYYGYFDCHLCYEYRPAASRFEPVSVTPDKRCPGRWSGDFLNYLTMSRIDCLRKVLYGGYRSTDTETQTVLERSFIPQDAHSWGKEYESIETSGYDIREYTPFSLPEPGTRHLFANTSLSETGPPLLRVLINSTYRIWEWVSIERPVAGTRCLNGATGPDCAHDRALVWEPVPVAAFATLTMTAYDTTGYARCPADHNEFDALIAACAVEERKLGSGIAGTLNGVGNPWSNQQDNYLIIFEGQLRVPRTETYIFAVDGSDAAELIIDGNVISGWYGAHAACNCTEHTGTIELTAGIHRLVFRHQNANGHGSYGLVWQRLAPASVLTDYTVRVMVGVQPMPEANCKQYPSGAYKPIGLLQRYGESEQMYFGLLTGSYAKNLSGGVLRKNVGSLRDEINPHTGQFTALNGIIRTIDKLRVYGFRYEDYMYEPGWPGAWIATRPMTDGEQRNWGNPVAEMMYEAVRYFAGTASPTPDFDYQGATDDTALGLPKAVWNDPYNHENGFSYCAKPNLLVLSDANPSYDSDSIPGTAFGSYGGDIPGLNVAQLANAIGSAEGISGSYVIGQAGTSANNACTEKTITGLGTIRGLCPEAPSGQGSFYAAAVAYYGHREDVNSRAQNDQHITVVAAGMAPSSPHMTIPVGAAMVTVTPFAKSVGGCLGVVPDAGSFQPTSTVTDFYVEQKTADRGRFLVNFEDLEQGADHDMDATVWYEYQVHGDTVTISVASESANSCLIQHIGYIIAGTTEDGTYLVIRDRDTEESADVNYFLDAPQHPGTALPLVSTRSFTAARPEQKPLLHNPLWYAAKWGSFEDCNGNNIPDDPREWDADRDGTPDHYFYGSSMALLEGQLNKAFAAMMHNTFSGTAAAVWSAGGKGEGMLLQAFCKPSITDTSGQHTVGWTGYLQSLWIDAYGNLREDTVHDYQLNPAEDRIVEIVHDAATGGIRVKRYAGDLNNPDKKSDTHDLLSLEELQPLWEAGKKLWARAPEERSIFTCTDRLIEFNTQNAALLQPYLAVGTGGDYHTLGARPEERAANLIAYIRGAADHAPIYAGNPVLRTRDFTIDGETRPWLLGDIVHSTPVIVSGPVESYGLLYDDTSYREFYNACRQRETVVYVGANDGMLHAFSAGRYHAEEQRFTPGATVGIGEELWAYIPQNLLPHLKWLALPTYNHLSYVDLKPKVVDARIFNADSVHPNGWGTVLICGMNMGGKPITVVDDAFPGRSKTFSSSYAVLDVTDPERPPVLLWEKNFDGLGFTTSTPCVIKVHDAWLCVLSSGPTDYDGTSANPGRVYIVDLRTGTLQASDGFPGWFQTSQQHAWMNSPVALDKGLNYSVDAVYVGASSLAADGRWRGTIYKLAIPITNGTYTEGNKAVYERNPAQWKWSALFDAPAPLAAPFLLSVDSSDTVWIYAGSGRYVSFADKDAKRSAANQCNYLYGIKDPFYNAASPKKAACFHVYAHNGENQGCRLTDTDLFNADPYRIQAGGVVEALTGGDAAIVTFDKLENAVKAKDGWYRTLAATMPAERVLQKPALVGGMVFFPTFTPDTDACIADGISSLYALYYVTGTAFSRQILGNKTPNTGSDVTEKSELGSGLTGGISIQAGRQEGATVFLQKSTGEIFTVKVIPPHRATSGAIYWKERR